VAAAQKLVGAAEIVRVGYSKVNPSAWIRPHTGVDNTQLKLHLGLRVPDEAACATFTIGGDVRGWQQDRVIFFDDTYENTVWNNCTTARTVLQVVIRHPDFHSDSLT
jgi:beta-hydroxylase